MLKQLKLSTLGDMFSAEPVPGEEPSRVRRSGDSWNCFRCRTLLLTQPPEASHFSLVVFREMAGQQRIDSQSLSQRRQGKRTTSRR